MILRLKEARKSRNITQKELSRLTNIAQDQISRYENGQDMTSNNLKIFCKALDVSADYLLGLIDEDIKLTKKETLNLAKNLDNEQIKEISETLQKSANYFQELIKQNTE
ncbi:helix-turn-helix transcriptional regulator [Mycoplasmatota bacterium]|nr:helix-turn-helix transcriptional regulator [Mycoplasmatota bacterium]